MPLRLLSAVARETTGFSAFPFLSPMADQAFLIYDITVEPDVTTAAELFDISSNQLISMRTLQGDLDFPSVDSGAATYDFSKFSILDDNQVDKARIRILDHDFNVLAERIFTDAYLQGYTFVGGNFSPCGKYVTVSYVTANTVPNQTSTLKVLQTSDLTTVAEITLVGVIETNGILFEQKGKLYLSVVLAQGVLDFNEDVALGQLPPYLLQVYKVDRQAGLLSLKSEVPQPQSVANLTYESSCKKTMIVFGTRLALLEGELSIFNGHPSALPTDGDELRFYLFCKHLKKLESYNLNTGVDDVAITENDEIILNRYGPGDTGFFQLGNIDKHHNLRWEDPAILSNRPFLVSTVGNRVLVGEGSAEGWNNVQLYSLGC